MAGHVFLVHGDLMKLSCDAWLMPGGSGALPGETWWHAVDVTAAAGIPQGWGSKNNRVMRWKPLRDHHPVPWLVDVGGSRGTPIDWYLEAVREFLTRIKDDLANKPTRHGRTKPLVALPLVGTGQGGKRRESGAVAQALLPVLYDFTKENEIDLALVMIEGAAYSAAQAERQKNWQQVAWPDLDDMLLERAERLARKAARGQLVLFLGAGVSAAAGLPGWGNLLDLLAREKASLTDEEIEQLQKLSPLDRAHVIRARMDPGESLRAEVAGFFSDRSSHYALAHGLLAALPVDEAITTNYDTLFEQASFAAARPLTVLPYQVLKEPRRWLLKLHGCVEHPEDIVLTRDDYLTYRERREALAGIVQALLITRHMLFVGFSLEDDNFHQIIRAVRRAIPTRFDEKSNQHRRAPFGTSLIVGVNPLAELLWKEDLIWVMLREETAQAARALEVFLDRIAAGACNASKHLFDARYDEVLADGEKELRDLLRRLWADASPEAKDTPAWSEVENLLIRFGWSKRSLI